MEALKDIIQHAYDNAKGFREIMGNAGLSPEDIQSIQDLEKIPVLKKDQLPELQSINAPFGNFTTIPTTEMARIFMSPGPIYDPQTHEQDFWRFSEALSIAGFGKEDIVQNTFSYHLSPAGFMFDSALRELGATVIPAGTGNRELQIQVMKDLQVTGYVGTPSFLAIILDALEEKGWAPGKEIHINKVFFTAEMLTTEMRKRCEDNGISVYEGYGTADCGCIGFEDKLGPGLRLTNSAIVQICDPHTGNEAHTGEGEIVVTLYDKSYPLIRFGTGDLSRWVEGYEGKRIAGVLGRVSDGVKVKGMFVREKQLSLLMEEAGYRMFQGIVSSVHNQDEFELFIESHEELDESLIGKLQDVIRVTPILKKVSPGTFNKDEKRLIDKRLLDLKNA
ncbi:phenylacetate--CoA ligase family protein [Bacillus sp. DTU_2020_1000418_1_SI_GHA_SEK_038]|uniref:phenylacetate--CoA ligase family protein n=1 Tax=Bacillus sp. DTU_2020_1000418_1_SI_GHA_SEK_038 TaxID=3077585 RepID=UPI0028EF4333|nr:AMP-binding protein [Bacillus sp. DTU_2020_1000418_1_SI_GHA_SEK_038]WNS73749.1 phenylacetate--CoA ligase family protein [Bacillus sp. DTU_2020_1000418_1_SI_GHA_SEK_038]